MLESVTVNHARNISGTVPLTLSSMNSQKDEESSSETKSEILTHEASSGDTSLVVNTDKSLKDSIDLAASLSLSGIVELQDAIVDTKIFVFAQKIYRIDILLINAVFKQFTIKCILKPFKPIS